MRGSATLPDASASRRASPPVALANGAEHLGGRRHLGELARIGRADIDQRVELAVGGAPEARARSRAIEPRQSAGLARCERDACASRRTASVSVTSPTLVGHGLALDQEIAAAHDQAQRLFLEVGLLHQPVRQPAQQVEMRPAALVAARPQPDVVGEQQRRRGLRPRATARSSGLLSGPSITVVPLAARVSTRRNQRLQCGGLLSAPSRPRVTGWRLPRSVSCAWNGISMVRPLGSAGRIGVERRAPDAGRARVVRPGRDQHRAALAHIARDVVEIDDRQHALAGVAVEDDQVELA